MSAWFHQAGLCGTRRIALCLELHRGLEPLPTVYKTVALPVVLMKHGGFVSGCWRSVSNSLSAVIPRSIPFCKVFSPDLTLSEKPYILIITRKL